MFHDNPHDGVKPDGPSMKIACCGFKPFVKQGIALFVIIFLRESESEKVKNYLSNLLSASLTIKLIDR